MSRTQGTNLRVVLYEGPGSSPLSAEDRYQAVASLLDNGFEVTRPSVGGQVAKADASSILLLGRFEAGRAPKAEANVHVRDLAVPEIELVGPRAQPVVLIERASLYVRVRMARGWVNARARVLALRCKVRRRLIDAHYPPGSCSAAAATAAATATTTRR